MQAVYVVLVDFKSSPLKVRLILSIRGKNFTVKFRYWRRRWMWLVYGESFLNASFYRLLARPKNIFIAIAEVPIVRSLLLLLLSLSLIGAANAQVIVSINAEYRMDSLDSGKDIFILRFKNINETTNMLLNLDLPPIRLYGDYSVRSIPAGGIDYKVVEINNTPYLLVNIKKVLTPLEEYEVIIEREIDDPFVRLDGIYRFVAMEYPDFFLASGIYVSSIKIALDFPNKIYTNYKVISLSSNSRIIYGVLDTIDRIEWVFSDPKTQSVAIVEFVETPNYFFINVLGASLTALAFVGLFILNARLERKLKSHEFISSPPFSGEILTRMKEMIKRAEKEVLLTSPHIYYTDWLTAELQPLFSKGVDVKIITWPGYERRQFKSVEEVYEDKKQLFTLKRFLEMFPKGSVKLNDNIHSKVLIIDEREVLLTTANLTQTGLFENYESGIYAKNEELAKAAREYFYNVWNSEESVFLTEEMLDVKKCWEEIMKRKEARR